MKPQNESPVGLTKDTGWQIGHRRTLPIRLEEAWLLLVSPPGVRLWLGESPDLKFVKGAQYRTAGGTTGEGRVFHPDSHLRITRQPGDYPRPSTIQVRVAPRGEKTVIVFHEEHLPDQEQREVRKSHYKAAADSFEAMIGGAKSV